MTLQVDTIAYCYPWGSLGSYITYLVVFTPLFRWVHAGGWAEGKRDLFFHVMSQHWLLTTALVYVLRNFSSWSESRPHPECSSADDFGGPSYAVALIFHILLQDALISLYFQVARSLWSWLWTLFQLVGIPAWLIFSGNTALTQFMQGALLGAGMAFVCTYLTVCVLLPLMPVLSEGWLLERFGMRHSPDIRAHYDP